MEIEEVLAERLEAFDQIRDAISDCGFDQLPKFPRGVTQDAVIQYTGLMNSGENHKLIDEVLRVCFGYKRIKTNGNRYYKRSN